MEIRLADHFPWCISEHDFRDSGAALFNYVPTSGELRRKTGKEGRSLTLI
jgi:hypothetical protein